VLDNRFQFPQSVLTPFFETHLNKIITFFSRQDLRNDFFILILKQIQFFHLLGLILCVAKLFRRRSLVTGKVLLKTFQSSLSPVRRREWTVEGEWEQTRRRLYEDEENGVPLSSQKPLAKPKRGCLLGFYDGTSTFGAVSAPADFRSAFIGEL
jgi:hypothetical protein